MRSPKFQAPSDAEMARRGLMPDGTPIPKPVYSPATPKPAYSPATPKLEGPSA